MPVYLLDLHQNVSDSFMHIGQSWHPLHIAQDSHILSKKLPKCIKWSAVPSPCSTLFLNKIFLVFLRGGGKQGSGYDREQSPVEWRDFLSVRSSIRLPPHCHPARHVALALAGCASGLASWITGLASWASGLLGWASGLAG